MVNPLKIEVTEAMLDLVDAEQKAWFERMVANCENEDWEPEDLWRCVLTAAFQHQEFQAQLSQWRPIESAPRDGTRVLVANEHGCWMAEYQPVYVSGYRPENPWFSVMLNCDHIPMDGRYAKPTHWRPLPEPPRANLGRVLGEG